LPLPSPTASSAPPPSSNAVVFETVVDATVDTFDVAAFSTNLASYLAIPSRFISIAVRPGSVIVTSTISESLDGNSIDEGASSAASSPLNLTDVGARLRPLITGTGGSSTAAASAVLGVSVLVVTVEEIWMASPASPPPPLVSPAAAAPPPLSSLTGAVDSNLVQAQGAASADGDLSSGTIYIFIGSLCAVLLLGGACILGCYKLGYVTSDGRVGVRSCRRASKGDGVIEGRPTAIEAVDAADLSLALSLSSSRSQSGCESPKAVPTGIPSPSKTGERDGFIPYLPTASDPAYKSWEHLVQQGADDVSLAAAMARPGSAAHHNWAVQLEALARLEQTSSSGAVALDIEQLGAATSPHHEEPTSPTHSPNASRPSLTPNASRQDTFGV